LKRLKNKTSDFKTGFAKKKSNNKKKLSFLGYVTIIPPSHKHLANLTLLVEYYFQLQGQKCYDDSLFILFL